MKKCAQLSGSISSLSKVSGVAKGTLDNYIAGRFEPKMSAVVAIADAVEVSIVWLVAGRGPMRLGEQGESELVKIPRYEAYLSAGAGSWNSDQAEVMEEIPFPKRWLMHTTNRETAEDLMLLEVESDSMEPTISRGDLVLIDRHNCCDRFDGIYAFVRECTACVKRLHFKSRSLEIISDNVHMYSKEVLTDPDLESFHIIGRVCWIGKSLKS